MRRDRRADDSPPGFAVGADPGNGRRPLPAEAGICHDKGRDHVRGKGGREGDGPGRRHGLAAKRRGGDRRRAEGNRESGKGSRPRMKAGGTASRACAAVVAEAFAANLLPYPAGPTRVGREPLGRRFPAVPGIPWPGDASRRRPPSRGAGMCPAPSSCVKAGRLCAWRRRGGRPEPAVRGAASARRFPMRPAGAGLRRPRILCEPPA